MSNNEGDISMVRRAAAQIELHCPQLVNAARVLTAQHRSKVALEHMKVFRSAWERHVGLLTNAVDYVTAVEDFLAVSGTIYFTFAIVYYFMCLAK